MMIYSDHLQEDALAAQKMAEEGMRTGQIHEVMNVMILIAANVVTILMGAASLEVGSTRATVEGVELKQIDSFLAVVIV